MEIIKILGVAFVTAIVSVLLRSTKPELSFAVITAGVFVILMQIFSNISKISNVFIEITSLTGIENELLKLLLKLVSIGYLTEISAGILIDFGNVSLADKVVLGGKLTIILLSLPVIKTLLNLMQGFLKII